MAGKASFNWIDPLLLDQQLTEEERMVRDSARALISAAMASAKAVMRSARVMAQALAVL